MTDEDKELARRVIERVRRKHYKPPDLEQVTEWAYETCVENLISETQLYCCLLDRGEDYSSAYRMVYGPPPHEVYGDDWKSLAAYMRKRFGWSLEAVADYLRGWCFGQCASTVRRCLDEDAAERQRQHDRDYWQRVQQDGAKYQKRLEAMRQYSRERYARLKNDPEWLARRCERRRNKEHNPRVPEPDE